MRVSTADTHLVSNPGLPYLPHPKIRRKADFSVTILSMFTARRRTLFLDAAVLVVVVLIVYAGIGKNLFMTIWWWDIPAHVLGGVWVALGYAYLMRLWNKPVTFPACVGVALAVGVGWEIFEYILGIGGSVFMSYAADTTKDLVDDCIGGAIAYFVSKFL